uniref:Uncharacterized protein n=1 Tax=Meloidogyne enterolobii TaxID=390850 RepID=A0A6V7XL08_MELEN|nr:unnamed protein product [Meloidogyne enterolobii]
MKNMFWITKLQFKKFFISLYKSTWFLIWKNGEVIDQKYYL